MFQIQLEPVEDGETHSALETLAESIEIIQLRRLLITINHSPRREKRKMREGNLFLCNRAFGAFIGTETAFSSWISPDENAP